MTRNKERYAYVYMGGSQQISPKTRRKKQTNEDESNYIYTRVI
jgi:hypothetical protein